MKPFDWSAICGFPNITSFSNLRTICELKFISAICTTAVNPTGGSVKLQTDGYITKAVYECDVDYSLEGNEILTCRADGTWDLTPPSCGM